jgi:hypothetical protein
MKRLENLWIAAACLAALSVVIGLVLVRRTSDPPIYLRAPASMPTTQGFKLSREVLPEFAAREDVSPGAVPSTGTTEHSNGVLLPAD